MPDTPEEIVAKLTEAQRDALLSARVFEPHSCMPGYYAVEIDESAASFADMKALREAGLVDLQVRTWGRTGAMACGEIHHLGLSVRQFLERQSK